VVKIAIKRLELPVRTHRRVQDWVALPDFSRESPESTSIVSKSSQAWSRIASTVIEPALAIAIKLVQLCAFAEWWRSPTMWRAK